MGVYLRPLNGESSLNTDFLWWYRLLIYGRLCPICLFRELGFGGSIFVPKFRIFNKPVLEEYVFHVEGVPHLL